MKRIFSLLVCLIPILWSAACGGSSSANTPGTPVVVIVAGGFATVGAGAAPITLTASVSGDSSNSGVTWILSAANTNCSPACGTLKPAPAPSLTAVYTPPSTVPTNQTATITVRSVAANRQVFVFNFQIVPPISVSITNKFSSQTAGGPVVDISATITNDTSNAGLTWTLTAGGVDCTGPCGTLTADPAPALTAHYTPPATPPTGANAPPTITATSVADPTQKDSFTFNILAPPIAVTILNKFSFQAVGGAAVNVNASVANDFTNAGLTWTLTTSTGPCSPACGTLAPSAAPSLSASYTAPATVPTGPNASPTITATSVADPTKSDSFTFSLVNASSLLIGHYTFLLRGYNSTGTTPLALAGSFVSDGAGNISAAELEMNSGGVLTSFPPPLTGTYTVDTSSNGIPRVSVTIATLPTSLTFKAALSSDGKRGYLIQVDSTLNLNSGTLLQQDAAALSADNPAGSYAFGVDSDAPINARIVEAGQFTLGASGVTGGLADGGQYGATSAIFGGPSGGAPIAAGPATAPDSFGRGTLTLSIGGNATQYAYYLVSSQQLNLIEIDNGAPLLTVFAGTAQKQKTLDANVPNTTSVVALTGLTSVSGVTAPDVIIGVFSISGGASSTANFDTNSAGNVAVQQSTTGVVPVGSFPTAAFDPATGRILVVNSPTISTNFVGAAVIYYYDTGKGFVIDITPTNGAGFNHAFSGPLIPQAAGPFTLASALSGNLIGRAGASASASIPNLDIAATFNSSVSPGAYSATGDLTTSTLTIGSSGQVANVPLNGQYLLDDPILGRGRMSFTGGVFGNFSASSADIASYYLIGPNQFVAIEQSGLGPSGILFFSPQ